MKGKTDTAMIFAAGLGTRLRPLTDHMPKALVPYRGVPMLELLIRKLKASGFRKIVINIHHFAGQIEDFIRKNGSFGIEILFSDERDLLRDTGGGIRHARPLLEGDAPILIHNVDILSDLDLNRFCEEGLRCGSIASLLVSRRDTSRYLLFEKGEKEKNLLKGWTDLRTGAVKSPFGKIAPEDYQALAFGGIHLVSQQMLPLMDSWPEKFSIIDFYLSAAAEHDITGIIAPDGTHLKDIGKPEQLEA